jgi:hypothetical protein
VVYGTFAARRVAIHDSDDKVPLEVLCEGKQYLLSARYNGETEEGDGHRSASIGFLRCG